MASGTVGYTDTRGNKDYSSIIANQIGKRLTEASNMAASERAYAENQAEAGGTSLSEAGIGKGYFFRRALGSRFGGDRIARTKGRLGIGGAGTNPAGDFKSRFRGGFDYNVTNEIQTATVPLASALVGGLRGIEGGLSDISNALTTVGIGMGSLANAQEDLAKQSILNGAFMQAFLNHMQREGARQRARSEERGLETGLLGGSGGGGGGRGMINVTPPSKPSRKFSKGNLGDFASAGTGASLSRLGGTAAKTGQKGVRTAVRGVTTGVASPIIKGARTIQKTAVNIPKLGQAASKYLGTGISNTTKFFRGAMTGINNLNPFGKAFTDAKLAMSADGMFNYARKGSKSLEMLKDLGAAGMNKNLAAIYAGGGTLDDFVKAMVGGGMPVDMMVDQMADYTQLSLEGLGKPSRTIGKRMTPKAANVLAPQRIASLDNAGYKTAEIASDQLVKKGVQQGLKRGSGLARLMVKNFGAAGTRSILKKIPILAGIAGTIFAIQRALEGDFLGAGLELTSGFLGATGIGGLGPGLAIDGFLLARDFGVVPMADGGIVQRPLVGEAGPEAILPLKGARGKKTFKMMGEGTLEARLDNKSDDSELLALGHRKYYETMGGWKKFGEGILEAFGNIKDKVGETLSSVNPFSAENLSNVNNSGAANSFRNFIGSEKDDGYLGPKWLGIKNPFADEQANALNNSSAQIGMGSLLLAPTIVNNYNTVAAGGSGGEEEVSDGSFPYSFTAFNADYSLYSK